MGIPYVKGSETSRAAADSIKHSAPSDKTRVFQFIVQCGKYGATDDEIESALNMRHQSASARRRNLELAGAVIKTDRKRKTRSGRSAYVYTADPTADIHAARGRPRKEPGAGKRVKATTYMTRAEYADLCMHAATHDMSVADVIRRALSQFMHNSVPFDQL